MTVSVWLSLRLFVLMMNLRNEIEGLQLFTIPEVVINGLNFSLECKANEISTNINIKNSSGTTISCRPTLPLYNASCGHPAYSIHEATNTVSMKKVADVADQGEWECTHTTSPPESTSTNIIVQFLQPLPNGNLTKTTTAEPNKTINTPTSDTFTVFYGCFSSTVNFKWTTSSVEWIVIGKNTTVMNCAGKTTGYVATQTVADIWINLKTNVEEKLSVTILTDTNYEIHPASLFDQFFFKGKSSDGLQNVSAGKALGSVGLLGFGVTFCLLIIR